MNLLRATIATSHAPAPVFPLMCIKCIFNFTRLLLTLIWKGVWKGNWDQPGCLLCTFHCFTTSVKSPLIFLLCKIQSEPPESFLTETLLCLLTLSSPSRPLSGYYYFFYSAGMSVARPEKRYWSWACPCIYKCHYSVSDYKIFIATSTMWTCYKAMFLPLMGKIRALLAALFKEGLLGLRTISEQKRWQHRKASVSCLLGSPLLVSGSCSVPTSHSGLCVPSTRWTLADGNTILLFNYLKCCMQINLWHSMIEQGVCAPYPIFDMVFHISFFMRL